MATIDLSRLSIAPERSGALLPGAAALHRA
jgi:hypothetical protein